MSVGEVQLSQRRFKPESILITGACGFIGSNFVNEVWSYWPNATIFNLDNLQFGNIENVDAAVRANHDRYHFICGDYGNERLVSTILHRKKIDTVIHFAAISSVDVSYADPLETFSNNVTGMVSLLRASTNYGKLQRFVHISTDEVYGDSGLGEDETPKLESDSLNPTNPYSASKAACEQLVHAYRHSNSLPAMMVRMNNVYGPHQDESKVIPRFVKQAIAGEPFTIAGDGRQLRTWLHVSDACDAIRRLTEAGRIGEIYNIGTRDEHCILELAQLICENVAQLQGVQHSGPQVIQIKDRPYNDRRYFIDVTRIKTAVNWSPKMPFREGLIQTVTWYLKNNKNSFIPTVCEQQ